MADPARRRATYEDVLSAPRHMVAEIMERERWLVLGVWKDNAGVRAEPFEALELELGVLWADVQLG
jgi:hypothetical protein